MHDEFICPGCRIPLLKVQMEHGIFWACPRCGGRALSVELLRRTFTTESINPLWRHALSNIGVPGRVCPCCGRVMLAVTLSDQSDAPVVEVCRLCHFVWFDPSEWEELKPRPIQPPPPPLPAKAREAIALLEVERIARQAEGSDLQSAAPNEWWKQVAAFFGMPVEFDAPMQERRPWATWLLCLTIVAASLAALPNLRYWIDQFGLVPADVYRLQGATLFTSFFLHGGIIHLVGNIYFLFIFGDNVENFLRWPRYLFLIAIASLVGDLLHIAANPHSTIPCVGASGGIAGVIVFYALQFPHIRLGFLFRYWFYFRWIRLPAWFALVLWILFQIIGAAEQISGISGVSSLAHLGGAMVGLMAWILWRKPNFDRAVTSS